VTDLFEVPVDAVRVMVKVKVELQVDGPIIPLKQDMLLYEAGGMVADFNDPEDLRFNCEAVMGRFVKGTKDQLDGQSDFMAKIIAGLATYSELSRQALDG
jgi:hypothetical protein